MSSFRKFSKEQKTDIVLTGNYLGHRQVQKDIVAWLYYNHGFFIEVYYDQIKRENIIITCFSGMAIKCLEGYIDRIDISDLIER